MFPSSPGERPYPTPSRLSGNDAGDIFLRFVYGAAGDTLLLRHAENFFAGDFRSALQHRADQFLGRRSFCFRYRSAQQLCGGDIPITVEP